MLCPTWWSIHTAAPSKRSIASCRPCANWMEFLFWAPCDWSLLVAPQKRWWSGQASYPEDEDNLKDMLARCHAEGIKAAMYASRNPAGPFGWELGRRKP